MIKVEIEPNTVENPDDENYGYVLRVRDGHNDDVLLSSTSQAYRNPGFAQDLARRLWPSFSPRQGYLNEPVEHVTMVTTYRDGSTHTEGLR